MKKFLILLILFVVGWNSYTQYGNEWIDYDQNYYHFPIAEEGIYRISRQELIDAGINVNTFDPRNLQMFARGEEQAIVIEGESDGVFDEDDFIEFYAKGNDAYFDANLFEVEDDQINPHFSIYNDTIQYYITWNDQTNNLRYSIVADNNTTGQSEEAYFWKTIIKDYGAEETEYHGGEVKYVGNSALKTVDFTRAEGFVSRRRYKGDNITTTLNLGSPYTLGGLNSVFETKFAGQSNDQSVSGDHKMEVSVGSYSVSDTIYENREMISIIRSVPNIVLSNSLNVVYQSDGAHPSSVDTWSVGYFTLKYPHQVTLSSQQEWKISLNDGGNGKNYLKLNGYSNGGGASLFFDLTNNRKIEIQNNGTEYVLIPNTGSEKVCYLSNTNQIKSVGSIQPVGSQGNTATFINYDNLNYDYIIISHEDFIESSYSYRDYRNSNGYNVIVVDIKEIYHQFGEGVFRHPYSIRNFCHFAEDNWSVNPDYLLLVGKGVFNNDSYTIAIGNRNNIGNNFIPTYGDPGSDQLFSAGLEENGVGYKPSLRTGRLSVTNSSQVDDYLSKIILTESQEPDLWMKEVLHFAGGNSASETEGFLNFLGQMEEIIEDTIYGGNVNTFRKFDTNPISVDMGDSLRTFIENGVSIMNFMGHASGSTFDYAIDQPENYANEGKNPLMMGVSCNVGNMYGSGTNSGIENYVIAGQRGAAGFIASSTTAVASYGNMLVSALYLQMGVHSYGETIGECVVEAIDSVQSSNLLTKNTCLTMNLHGDPAFRFNSQEKPDYSIYTDNTNTQANIYTVPSTVSSVVDSFDVALVISNYGQARDTSFWVSVTRQYASNGVSDTVYQVLVDNVYYLDTVFIRMPVDLINGLGLNQLTVRLDALEEVDELDNVINNNVMNFPLLISSGDIVPIYPYEYAVIANPITDLKASTGDVFAPERTYVFQIDTTDEFNSLTHFVEYSITQSGGVVEWEPLVDPNLMSVLSSASDSMVFFWRCSLDSSLTDDGDFHWRESSFQYIDGKTGWGQDHFRQFKRDRYDLVEYNYSNYNWSFANNFRNLRVKTNYDGGNAIWEVGYWVDNAQRHSGVTTAGGYNRWLHTAILKEGSLSSWSTWDYDFDQYNVNGTGMPVNEGYNTSCFMHKNTEPDRVISVLDSASNGDYFVFWTRKHNYMSTWPDSIKAALGSYGVDTSLTNHQINGSGAADVRLPVIFAGRKGFPSQTTTVMGSYYNDYLQLDTTLISDWTEGDIESTLIGPAAEWGSLHWNASLVNGDAIPGDSIIISVYGVDVSGNETFIMDSIAFQADVLNLDDIIDANQFPYMKLQAFLFDTTNNTPPQMEYWHVLYEEIPEAALSPQIEMTLPDGELMEGLDYVFTYTVENVSAVDMDSLQVKYWMIDENNDSHVNSFILKDSLRAGEYMIDTISINTMNAVGINQLWLEVNPYDGPIPWQAEKYHFNNIANWQFGVQGDEINPILDVTFDGVHILNGDIVNPNPEILIRLDDENEFLALDDTLLFEVYVTYPDDISITPTRVYFSTTENPQNMDFTPAQLPENKASIRLNPNFTQDGDYTLLVRAKDRSSNISGKGEDGVYDYRIDFEVINQSTITNVLNYPNPFSTSTQFVFTLTGSEIPTEFKIQIMTVTGKVVREITRDELGDIHIGRNVTDFLWDGTDQFGDPLANGVYFYRVYTGVNGESIEHRETNADQYFKKGLGKLYIMR